MSKRLSIIVPVFNEERTIIHLLEKLTSLQLIDEYEKEIVIVDDHSSDRSQHLIADFLKQDARVIYHRQMMNRGKGAAVRKGIELASGNFLVFQDADLELDPNDINLLLETAIRTSSKVVYGSRLLTEESRAAFGKASYMANIFLTGLSNLIFRIRITDMETCYKLIDTDIAKSLDLKEDRFGFEPEVTAKLARIKDIRFEEVAISYESRSRDDGKKIGYNDGMRAIYCILKYGLFS